MWRSETIKKTIVFNIYLQIQQTTSFTDDFFLLFPENRIRHFMQIVSIGDNLHEMSNPVSW